MKQKLRFLIPVAAMFGLGITSGLVMAGQPSRPVATTVASGNLTNTTHTVMVAPVPGSTGTLARVVDVGEVRVVRFELAPGGAFPWHQHPGPVWVVVTKGTLSFYSAGCEVAVHPTGTTFFDPGNLTHTARNEGDEPVEILATFMFPADAGPAPSIPQPAPSTCPIEV